MKRRTFLAGATASTVAASFMAPAQNSTSEKKRYKACIIGDTKRGGYGHSLHLLWSLRNDVDVVALSDPDEGGRNMFGTESKAQRLYADYREMLEKERPDIVTLGPRWTINHREYLLACAAVGAHGILEKPLTPDLGQADEVAAAMDAKELRWAIAFNFRASPEIAHAKRLIFEEGLIGEILEVRSRGKEDHRSGGEDLIVLGIHLFDLMRYLLGDPQWCMAHISTAGKSSTLKDVYEATEPLGPILGDTIHASWGFERGITGQFASVKNTDINPRRWGLDILGTAGVVTIRMDAKPKVFYGETRDWAAGDIQWKPLPDMPAIEKREPVQVAHYAPIIDDLIAAIEEKRRPLVSLQDGLAATEMIQSVFESHIQGRRIMFPLENRQHPLHKKTDL